MKFAMTKKDMVFSGYVDYFEILLFSFLFVVNPLITIISFFILLLVRNVSYGDFSIKLFSFLLVIFLCLVNQTKVPENDYYYHALDYKEALQYTYFEYLYAFGKEPLYFTYVFVLSYLTGGDYRYWSFFNTLVSYTFIFKAVFLLLENRKIRVHDYLFTIFFLAFLPQLFSLSVHIERQFLATSVMMYSVCRHVCNKKSLLYDLIAVSIHSSLLFLFVLKRVRFMREKISKQNYAKFLLLLFAVLFYQIVAYYFSSVFNNIPFIGYIFERASKDTKYELEPLGSLEIFLALLPILAFFINYLKGKKTGYNLIYNLSIILSFFILLNIHQAELSNRFLFFLLFFLPFLYLDLTRNIIIPVKIIFSAFLFFYFLYKIDFGTWRYVGASELFSNSLFSYFSFNFSKMLQ